MTTPQIYDTPNSAFPHRPGYVRLDRADDLQPSQTTTNARQFDGTVFEQALSAIAHAQTAYHRHVDATTADRHRFSEQGYREQIAGFAATDAAKAIDIHADRVRARRDQAKADVAEIRRALSPDGDTASELRATRYWNRTKAVLDAQDAPNVITKGCELISQATPVELGTLLQELEPYSVARGVSTTDWIDASVGRAAPEYGRAVKQLTKAEQAVIMTEHNARRLQHAIATGQHVPIPLARPTRDGDYDPDYPDK